MEIFPLLTIIGRSISLPFLFLTYLHYWHTTKFRYLHRMCFMNYLTHLIVSNFWSIWAISNEYHNARSAHILHIFNFIELSLVLWTNVLCFNFWRSIRNLMPYTDNKNERITFIKCLIYVWSCDIIYTTIGTVNDYSFDEKYAHIHKTITWLMISFQVILLLINSSMITHATVLITQEIKAIKKLKGPDAIESQKKHKKKLILYAKLLVITIFMLCSKWLWSSIDNALNIARVHLIFNYFMVANGFQGIFIFSLFTLKKKKIKTFKTKVSELLTEPNTLETFTNTDMIIPNTKEEPMEKMNEKL